MDMAITARAQRLKERAVYKGPTGGEYQPGIGGCLELPNRLKFPLI